MTHPMELTPAGRDISQAEQDRWFKLPTSHMLGATAAWLRAARGFDPTAPISPLAARLLAASNALYSHVDFSKGDTFAEAGTTRHAGYVCCREPK